jgi:tetratricopeptide (TPR) repeat protein
MKLALAMIIKPTDDEAVLLDRCLESIAPYVDGIFITQAGTEPNKKVSKVIKRHKGSEHFYKWNDSFCDARNYSFSVVPKDYDYIMWLDADDVIRGAQRIRDVIEKHPDVDAFSFWYLYGFDEWQNPIVVHHKTRVIRNDGCVTWAGDIHEDFARNRALNAKHVDGIEVLHLTNGDRVETSKQRNAHVAQVHASRHPNDPRSHWVVANSLFPLGKYDEALQAFDLFLATSQSDDEKYIAYLRMAECHQAKQDTAKAQDSLRYAIGLKPFYPDAFIQLGKLYHETNRPTEAIPLLKHALKTPPPYYSIMVYNPRDYDYTPLKWLAYSYMAIHQPMLAYECFKQMLEITPKDERLRDIVDKMKTLADRHETMLKHYERIKALPKEEMRKELDAIPDDFKSEPMFCNLRNVNFIKETSSGRDMAILCGYTAREWTPDALKEGIGGSEEAVIHLARRFAQAGWNVTVYNNCGHKPQTFDGVTYAPFWTWNYRDKQDVTILWRHPKMADYDINSTKVFIDMHDVIQPGEFNDARLKRIDKIFVKSQFHRSLFPHVSDDKFVVIPNGIQVTDFEHPVERDPNLIINTSSPDRSLSALIRLFKRVKERVPEARCEWAYGFENFTATHSSNPKMMEWKASMEKGMEEAGIVNRGRVSHKDVALMYKRAKVFAYPTEFAEIDCISARKAQAGGAIPVTTDFAALNETVQFGTKIHSKKTKDTWCKPYQFDFSLDDQEAEDAWVEAVVKALKSNAPDGMQDWTKQFDWDAIAERWIQQI